MKVLIHLIHNKVPHDSITNSASPTQHAIVPHYDAVGSVTPTQHETGFPDPDLSSAAPAQHTIRTSCDPDASSATCSQHNQVPPDAEAVQVIMNRTPTQIEHLMMVLRQCYPACNWSVL